MKMKKYLVFIAWALGVSILFQGFVQAGMMGGGRSRANITIEPTGANLWELIKKDDYANRWKRWPGTSSFEPAHESHGALSTTYIGIPVFMAIARKEGRLPDNSIIVKENYSPDKQLNSITVMWKQRAYNPAGGNWFWATYAPDGKIEAEGKIDTCIQCHGKNESNDYIMTSPLK
jgi:hypothetical protein